MKQKKPKPNAFAGIPATVEARSRVEEIRQELGKPHKRSASTASRASRAKERVTFHIDPTLADRMRRAVYWTPGLTVTGLADRALVAELDRLERKAGKPFDPIPAGQAIVTGRPAGRPRR